MGVEQDITAITGMTGVRYVEPDYVVTPAATSNDPYLTDGTLWGMEGDATSPSNSFGSQAAEAWGRGYTGSTNVAVGIVDEGIQITHPELADNIWVNTTERDGTPGVDLGRKPRAADHVHGLDCGHEAVPHGDHVDYLVGSYLHHQHAVPRPGGSPAPAPPGATRAATAWPHASSASATLAASLGACIDQVHGRR